jgi:hypothetical protein
VWPEVFQVKLAAGAARIEQKETTAIGEALGKIGEKFRGNFANSALGLDDLRDRNELAYSKISSAKR